MVKRCVAAGCSSTNSDGVSLHLFPKDQSLRKQWIKQVQRHRAKWTATSYSVLCSKHFSDDCFEIEHKFASSFGLKSRKKLKPDAVPTIFERPSDSQSAGSSSCSQGRKRSCEPEETGASISV